MQIDTTSSQYQQYLTDLENLRELIKPRLVLFAKLPKAKQKLWLQRDPLLRKVFKMSIDLNRWSMNFVEDVKND